MISFCVDCSSSCRLFCGVVGGETEDKDNMTQFCARTREDLWGVWRDSHYGVTNMKNNRKTSQAGALRAKNPS